MKPTVFILSIPKQFNHFPVSPRYPSFILTKYVERAVHGGGQRGRYVEIKNGWCREIKCNSELIHRLTLCKGFESCRVLKYNPVYSIWKTWVIKDTWVFSENVLPARTIDVNCHFV